MPDSLLASKIHIPPLRSNLVTRPRLIQQLNDGITQNHRLVLLSAPAGYGKSTLLSEWVDQLDTPIAWLSLEKEENNPVRFWSYFCTALSTVHQLRHASFGETFLQTLQAPQPKPRDSLLIDLVNDLSKLEVGVILVLDDLHCIIEGEIHQDLVFLIDHLPQSNHGLHLVVASRMDPPWPLARWRVRDELIEVRTKDLRFSTEETFTFLNQIMRLNLTPGDIALLDQRTEGWIAGLQMAAVSMQSREDPASFLGSFSGTHRFVLDYLLEEVLSHQTPEVQNFLLQTSLLEYLTAPLCDAITDRNDSQEMLLRLEKSNMFLVPLDEERRWYRYHHLFAELLHKRLKEAQPENIAELHQRASRWYAENNYLSEAISHALDAGDFPFVNELVSGNAFAIVGRSELLEVMRHFEELPDGQIVSRPWLGLSYAWVKISVDPSEDVEHILEQIGHGMADIENNPERQRIESHMNAVRAYVAWVKGEADKVLVLVHRALENLPENDLATRANLFRLEGLAYQSLYNLPAAIQSFEAAVNTRQNSQEFSSQVIYSVLASARVHLLQGRLQQTLSDCQRVVSLVNEFGQILKPSIAHAYVSMSMVQLEFNNLETATLLARQGVALAEQWKQADTLYAALNCLSNALCAAGNLEEASDIIQRNKQLAHYISPLFVRYAAWDEIRFNLVKGNISIAMQMFAESESTWNQEDELGWFLITKAYLIFAQERYVELLSSIEEPVRDLERRRVYWYLMKLIPLQALALQALGREEDALTVIDHCLYLAEPEGYVRIFVERGIPMLKLLQLASHRGIHTEYINRLLPAFKIARTSRKPVIHKTQPIKQHTALVEPLSERELQVLRLLDSSLTSTEIGQELYVSQNTVRTHIRNIYSKLGVHGRIEAIQKAKTSGLI